MALLSTEKNITEYKALNKNCRNATCCGSNDILVCPFYKDQRSTFYFNKTYLCQKARFQKDRNEQAREWLLGLAP